MVSLLILFVVNAAAGPVGPVGAATKRTSKAKSKSKTTKYKTVTTKSTANPNDEKTAADRAETGGWWDSRVFYEIFVRSFADSNGDGIGDLRGASEKLPYVKQLGVGAVWLMPVTDGNTYHGYTVTNYLDVEKDYGTLDDMRAYVKRAHELDIKVIVDLVLNHTSDQHPWFQESLKQNSPKRDWYRWSATDPGERGPWGQQVWHRASNGLYYFGLFDRSQPDLNLTNPDVTAELLNAANFWLTDIDVDGFRLDAASHLIENGPVMENTPQTKAWWRAFRGAIKGSHPDAFLVGEVAGPARPAATYVPDGLDATFAFDLARGLVNGVRDREPSNIATEQAFTQSLYGVSSQYASFLTNHDQNRVGGIVGSLARSRVAAAELLTRPGIPFVYYGEEVGMRGAKPDELIRTPMPWTRSNSGFTTGTPWEPFAVGQSEGRTVADAERDPQSLLAAYRSLIALRSSEPALQSKGALIPLKARVRPVCTGNDCTPGVPLSIDAFLRISPDVPSRRLLVLHNLGDAVSQLGGAPDPIEIAIPLPTTGLGSGAAGKVGSILNLGWPNAVVNIIGSTVTVAGPIPPTASMVLELT